MNEHHKITKLIIDYLQNKLSLEEKYEFYKWVHQNEGNLSLYFDLKAIYDACSNQFENKEISAHQWEKLKSHIKKEKSTKQVLTIKSFGIYGLVASVAIAFTLFSTNYFSEFSIKKSQNFNRSVITSSNGLEANTIEMADGTKIYLGSTSQLYADDYYGQSTRTIHLEGEAFLKLLPIKNFHLL